MGKHNWKHEEFAIPRLSEAIKKKNGVSSRRLHKCIESLDFILDEETQAPEASEQPESDENLDDVGQDN